MKYVCHGCVLMLEWFRRRRRTGLIPVHHGSKNVLKRGNWDLLIAVFFNAAAQLYWSVNPFVNMHYIIKLCYGVQCAVCPSTTRCRQWYTCLHALTHCIRWHPLIHRSSDTLSSLTRKNTLQTRGHCTHTDSLLLSKFLILSSRWQLRSLTEFSLRETGGRKLIKSLQNRAEKRWWINSHYLSHTPLSGTGKIHLMVLSYVSVGLCLSCNPLENQWPEFRVWMVFAKCSFIGSLSSLLQHWRLFSVRHKKYYKIMPNNLPNVAVWQRLMMSGLILCLCREQTSCLISKLALCPWF